jgi:hypothetical protein
MDAAADTPTPDVDVLADVSAAVAEAPPPAAPAVATRTTPRTYQYTHIVDPDCDEVNMDKMDAILDREKGASMTDPWNKINDRAKLAMLGDFADRYGETNVLSPAEVAALKRCFATGIERNKLKRVKEVDYDKTTQRVKSVPVLQFNAVERTFTLRNVDPSRVSTLKSLTPKRAATLKNPLHPPVAAAAAATLNVTS